MAERPSFPIGVHVFLVRDSQLFLIRRANTGYKDGHWGVPAGHLEYLQPASLEACREAQEEAGVEINPADLNLVHTVHIRRQPPNLVEYLHLYFAARKWAGEPSNREPEKSDQCGWFPLTDLPSPLVPETAAALLGLAQNRTYSEVGWSD